MALLTVKQMAAIQRIGEQSFRIEVEIQHRLPFEKDDSNPMGDSVLTYKSVTTKVKGWLVPDLARSLTVDVAQVMATGAFRLRLPVGTAIEPGDRVTVSGLSYAVADSSSEQSWPEWITVRISRIQ